MQDLRYSPVSASYRRAFAFPKPVLRTLGDTYAADGSSPDVLVGGLHMRAALGDVDQVPDLHPFGIIHSEDRAGRASLLADLALPAILVAQLSGKIEVLVRQYACQAHLAAVIAADKQRVFAYISCAARSCARAVRAAAV